MKKLFLTFVLLPIFAFADFGGSDSWNLQNINNFLIYNQSLANEAISANTYASKETLAVISPLVLGLSESASSILSVLNNLLPDIDQKLGQIDLLPDIDQKLGQIADRDYTSVLDSIDSKLIDFSGLFDSSTSTGFRNFYNNFSSDASYGHNSFFSWFGGTDGQTHLDDFAGYLSGFRDSSTSQGHSFFYNDYYKARQHLTYIPENSYTYTLFHPDYYGSTYQMVLPRRTFLKQYGFMGLLLDLSELLSQSQTLQLSQFAYSNNYLRNIEKQSSGSSYSSYASSEDTPSYAFIDFPSNSVPEQRTLTRSEGDTFFTATLSLLRDHSTLQASQTMFLKHILERVGGGSYGDHEEEMEEVQQQVEEASQSFNSLRRSFDFSELNFKDHDDYFDFDSVISPLKNSSLPSKISFNFVFTPPAMPTVGIDFEVSTSSLSTFLDVSRSVCLAIYWMLIATIVFFAFRFFIPFMISFVVLVSKALNW